MKQKIPAENLCSRLGEHYGYKYVLRSFEFWTSVNSNKTLLVTMYQTQNLTEWNVSASEIDSKRRRGFIL